MKYVFQFCFLLSFISLASAQAINIKADIIYKSVDQRDLKLDLYYPENNLIGKYPVVIYTHGGGWATGSKKAASGRTGMSRVVRGLVEKGFCVASVDYRLWKKDGNTVIRDCVIDSKDAIRFLAKNSEKYHIDAQQVFTFGDSAGGHIAQMLLLTPPKSFIGDAELAQYTYKVVAGISWYGPCDFENIQLFNHDGRANFRNRFNARLIKPDTAPKDKMALYKEVSPVNYLSKDSAPLLMIQGDQDTTIPVHHAHYMKAKADLVGANVQLIIVKNSTHNWRAVDKSKATQPELKEIVEETVEYMNNQFKKSI